MANNGILKYTSRDYDSIKTDLIDSISALTDLWTSREESDPGIVLIKEMSALGDMLSYNFDKQALEYYAPTVTQRKNANKLFGLVGYRMRWYQSALTTVTLKYIPEFQQGQEWLAYSIAAANTDDEEEIINIYYSYRAKYPHLISYGVVEQCSNPPLLSTNPVNIDFPSWWTEEESEGHLKRFFWTIANEPRVITLDMINDPQFRKNAIEVFKPYCDKVRNMWIAGTSDIPVYPLRTYVDDPNKAIELYSSDSGNVVYSLVPQIPPKQDLQSQSHNPSYFLKPYEEYTFTAIQGYLASVNFNNSQLQNNRFYLPDSAIDDTYMYLSYDSVMSSGTTDRKVGFAQKVDNLLTVTTITDSDGEDVLYFQFGIDDYDYPYVELISYWNNLFPESSVNFTLYYFRSVGQNGNITTNYLNRLSNSNANTIQVKNVDTNISVYGTDGRVLSMPGKNPQTAKDAYIDSINYIMTYNTLVTIYDFARFSRRQPGISNAIVADNQRMRDLNRMIGQTYKKYSIEQLRNVLGITDTSYTEDKLKSIIYEIQKVRPDNADSPVYFEDGNLSYNNTEMENYSINVYPIYGNYVVEETTIDEEPLEIATLSEKGTAGTLPYRLYKIHTSDEGPDVTSDMYKIETMFDEAFNDVQICNVKPRYTSLRVFDWVCCCVLHLTKSVSPADAKQIVTSVINTLTAKYSPYNVEIGKKIPYMDVIETILSADDRIRYVDAGLGSKKLIEFISYKPLNEKQYSTEAYFNPISIMKYSQTVENNFKTTNRQYNYISVDPTYIQEAVYVNDR